MTDLNDYCDGVSMRWKSSARLFGETGLRAVGMT